MILEKKYMKRYPICLMEAYYYYILDEIEPREKIDFKRNVSVNIDKKYY